MSWEGIQKSLQTPIKQIMATTSMEAIRAQIMEVVEVETPQQWDSLVIGPPTNTSKPSTAKSNTFRGV